MKYQRSLVSIGTEKIEECVTFYKHLLGYPPRIYKASSYAEFDLPGLVLGIFKPRLSENNVFDNHSRSGGLSICLEVTDLEATVIYLTNLGYLLECEITSDSSLKELYIYDPSGNRIIIYQYY